MNVDEPGCDDQPGDVNDGSCAVSREIADLGDTCSDDADVGAIAGPSRPVENSPTAQNDVEGATARSWGHSARRGRRTPHDDSGEQQTSQTMSVRHGPGRDDTSDDWSFPR